MFIGIWRYAELQNQYDTCRYRTPWLCLLHIKYQQTNLFASPPVLERSRRDERVTTEFVCLPSGIRVVALNRIAGDAGVMLLLLDVIYFTCQMLTRYHYYCQKSLVLFLYICNHSCFLLPLYVCVRTRAPARDSRNDGTQARLAAPRSGTSREFSRQILYSGEPLKCIN